ncbi:glycosyltransferase [Actinomyces trachealis]|uniref:glycosyltransferase n=1 Tax=Actinomyces trachealis TaxID=2763540 RepID=UPI0018929EC4|nr:glycosyltransferase [Actinomyces trachealis]
MSSSAEQGSRQRAGVTAVLVCAGVTPYLAKSLRALAAQTLAPDIVLLVDVASRQNGLGDGTPVEEIVEATELDQAALVRIVRCPEARGFREAVSQGLEAYATLVASGNGWRKRPGSTASTGTQETFRGPTGAMSPITEEERAQVAQRAVPDTGADHSRLWLLHDDCAPEPKCLEELVEAIVTSRSVALAGPKQVGWDHPEQLLEVGLVTTASARRANDIAEGEIDQGQLDDRSDVLAVGSVGALIDRDVWEKVGGPSPLFPVFGDGLELSRAVRLAGHRVVVAPAARLRHRRASYLGLRPHMLLPDAAQAEAEAPTTPTQPDADRSFYARRTAQLTSWASFSGKPLRLLLAYFMVLGGARALWRLLAKDPNLAVDELKAARSVLKRREAIAAERSRLTSIGTATGSLISELYTNSYRIQSQRRDHNRQQRERAARAAAPSELEVRELAAIKTTRRLVLGLVLALALAAGGLAFSKVLLTRSLVGGALTAVGMDWRQTWSAAWSTWAFTGDGLATAPNPILAVLSLVVAALSPLGVKSETVVSLLLHLAVPLAALGAWYAAGAISRRPAVRAWAALTWAAAPALLLAVGQGRLPAVIVHLVLPWALLSLARALGADRRDVILSGMVGAQRLSSADRRNPKPFEAERRAELAKLARSSSQDEVEDTEASSATTPASKQRGPVDDDPATPVIDDATGVVVSASTRRGARIRAAATEQYGPSSTTAAAAAGLLIGVIASADASVGSMILLLLLGATVLVSIRAHHLTTKLLFALTPAAALLAPAWWAAFGAARATGALFSGRALAQAAHTLATVTGAPVAVAAPSSIDLLLGLPADPHSLGLGSLTTTILRGCLLLLPLLAALSVPMLDRHGRRARVGLVLALAGLVCAMLCLRATTGIGADARVAGSGQLATVPGWAGAGLSLLQAGLLLSAVVLLDRFHSQLVRHTFGWRHLSVGVVNGAALLIAVCLLATWSWSAHTGYGGPIMMLHNGTRSVPAIAAETQRATGGRVLAISTDAQGLTASLWRADGLDLMDVVPAATSANASRVTDANPSMGQPKPKPGLLQGANQAGPAVTLTSDAASQELSQLLVNLTAGQQETVAPGLARHGVAVVLLTDLSPRTTEAASGIAATPGLEQLASTKVGKAWRVSPANGGEVSGALVQGRSESTAQFLPWGSHHLSAELPASTDGSTRTLYLAERSDPGWRATLNGQPLKVVPDPAGWRQAFDLPATGGHLEVGHTSLVSRLLTLTIWVVCGVTALAALPLRRPRNS